MGERSISQEEARAIAADVLLSRVADDDLARRGGRILDPIALVAPDGSMAGWVVPVALAARLLGFIQLERDGTFHRYAAWDHRGEHPHLVQDWLDESQIIARASRIALSSEQLSRPRLSYHRHPDRLAWEVIGTAADGTRRRILVAGEAVWAEPIVQ